MPRDPAKYPLDDRIRALHMLEAARDARDMCQGRARSDLDSDIILRRALVNCIQVIGEAASKVSAPGRVRFQGIEWSQIVGIRHRLVHDYMYINLDMLWTVAEGDLTPLIGSREMGLAAWQDPPSPPNKS